MFEQLEDYLNQHDYRRAAAILGFLGKMMRPRLSPPDESYSTAQVRVLPLADTIHVFMVIDDHQEWWQIPGDLQPAEMKDGHHVLSKIVQLQPHFDPEYRRHIRFHFVHVQAAEQAELVA